MNLALQLFAEIESPGLAAHASMANNFKQFVRSLYRQQSFVRFISEVRAGAPELVIRIRHLSKEDVADGYESRHDVSIASYMLLLSLIDLDAAQTVSKAFLGNAKFWWSRRAADRLSESFDDSPIVVRAIGRGAALLLAAGSTPILSSSLATSYIGKSHKVLLVGRED